jgi:FkbM family methyltransferase
LWSNNEQVELTDPGKGHWAFRVTELGDSVSAKIRSGNVGQKQVAAVTVPGLINEYGLSYIDLLKLDIEGSEKEVLASSAPWISHVGAICIELHDRFKPGCSREFYRAANDFPVESRRGETVMVMRD